jgi:hypothetical protein
VRRTLRVLTLVLITAGPITSGCGAEDVPDPDGAPVVNRAVARAQRWVDVQVPYCQAPNHAQDHDAECASTCTRPDNPAWDPYRSDCSGFVSYAWGLPSPGRTTLMFAPFDLAVSAEIAAIELAPGDAVNNDHHMMLFKRWITPGVEAVFMDEPGCSSPTPYAQEFTAQVTLDDHVIAVQAHGSYIAIRQAR